METHTLPAPKISAVMLELVTIVTGAAIVQTDDGATFALEHLTTAQAEDPTVVVLVDHSAALDYVARAGGRVAAGTKLANAALRAQHARGLL